MIYSQTILAAGGGASAVMMFLLAILVCAVWIVLYFLPVRHAETDE